MIPIEDVPNNDTEDTDATIEFQVDDPQTQSGFIGFNIKARESNNPAPNLRNYLLEKICSSNEEYYDYLMNCLAHMVQFPRKKLNVVLVLCGKHETGKSIVTKVMLKIFGRHGIEVKGPQFIGNFEPHQRKLLIILNEAVLGGHTTKIVKQMATESCFYERKGFAAKELQNYWNFIVNCDNLEPHLLNDRRLFVLEASESRIGDNHYFDDLHEAVEQNETEEFLYYLQNRPLPPLWSAGSCLPSI